MIFAKNILSNDDQNYSRKLQGDWPDETCARWALSREGGLIGLVDECSPVVIEVSEAR